MPCLHKFVASLSLLLATACTTPAPHHAFADEYGDPVRGRAYAQDHCAACHAVNGGVADLSPHLDAPTFREVANTSGFTRMAFGAWLRSVHEQMPDYVIETDRIDDLYVYLETLRTAPSAPPQH